MVLRKPYALLIKHFKLIHLVLVLLMAYLLYKTGMVLNFFNHYIADSQGIILDNVRDSLFNMGMFLLPFVIITVFIILLSVMVIKKKPFTIYIINTIIYILVLAVFNITFNIVGNMSLALVDTRIIRMARDFSIMCLIAEAIAFLFMLVRATGFDIKKFNFGQDLQELQIEEQDSEEFEVDMSVDTNEVKRNLNRRKRYIRYIYLENRFIIHVALLIVVSVASYFIYINATIYNKTMDPNVYFSTSYFTIRANKSYITNDDYRGNSITPNKTLIVVELEVKNRSFKGQALNTTNIELHIGNHKYYHTSVYRDKLFDLGHVYEDNEIGSNFEKQLLVFEVPKDVVGQKMELKYIDEYATKGNSLKPKYITVPLSPISLDNNQSTEIIKENNSIHFTDGIIGESLLVIDQFDIQKKYQLPYSFCVNTTECYNSVEYLYPTLTENTDKALLKIVGSLKLDEKISLSGIYNIYNFLQYFSTLQYEINGVVKTQTIPFKQVFPSKTKEANTYYIEVPQEMMNAEHIMFQIKVRNQNYEFILK